MIRKIIFTILWTIGLCVGAFFIGVVLSSFLSFFCQDPVQRQSLIGKTIGVVALVSLILGGIGLVLGILGRLPGTKMPHIEEGK